MSVGRATRLRAGRSWVQIQAVAGDCLFSKNCSYQFWGPPSLRNDEGVFDGVNRPQRDVDGSSLGVTDVKICWICISTPPIHHHCVEGIILTSV
jgi:hypothetical protein